MRTEFLVEECLKMQEDKEKRFSKLDQLNKKYQEQSKKLSEILEKKDFSNFILLSTIYGNDKK